MKAILLLGSLALALSACSGSSDDGAGPDAPGPTAPGSGTPGGGSGAPATPGADAASFFSISADLDEAGNALAELTRSACFADYERLRGGLGSATSVERFHRPGEATVDVEWIEPDAGAVAVDGPVTERRGAGATLVAHPDADGASVCAVVPYVTFGDATAADGVPASAFRLADGDVPCSASSAHPAVETERVPLLSLAVDNGVRAYGSAGTRYVFGRGGAEEFVTSSVVGVSRATFAGGRVEYRAACSVPARLPNGDSVLLAPTRPTTPAAPAGPAVPGVPTDGTALFLGRPWQESARRAQDAVDALGVHAMREHVDSAADALGLRARATVERGCPGGGSASATSSSSARHDERHYAFDACDPGDGRTLDGTYDSVRSTADTADSIRRGLEESFRMTLDSAALALEVRGTLSEGISGKGADACGLVSREDVLRLDVPLMRTDDVAVRQLAIEDITDTRIEPAATGACGRQVTEHAFSDSARVADARDASDPGFSVNRNGSVLADADGRLSSSGNDIALRIYDPRDDASLHLAPDFSRPDGVSVTIDNYPGRSELADVWTFLTP